MLQSLPPEQRQKILANPQLHKIYLKAQLRLYLMSNVGCHKQGTEEWKKAKEVTIGGSEIATVLGLNRFSTITDLLYGKLGLIPRKRDIKMQWGKVFEPLICEYVERDKDVEILGQDLFVLGKKSNQSYSPDGLGVMLVDSDNGKKEYRTMLFEFKCPYNRLLKGGVPEYYLPQVLTGLDTIPIADQGIFIEAMFRRCLWQDCDDTPTYDRELTPRDLVRTAYKPLARGFVLFALDESALTTHNHIIKLSRLHNLMKNAIYSVERPNQKADQTNNEESVATDEPAPSPAETKLSIGSPVSNENIIYNKPVSYSAQQLPQAHYLPVFGKCLKCDDRYLSNASNERQKCKCGAVFFDEFADLGDCPYDIFEFMLDLYEDKILRPIYSKMFLIDRTEVNNEELQPQLAKMLNEAKQQNLLIYGILPYKLLRIEYNFVDKVPGYVENLCQSKIDELINIVKKCKENPVESKSIISRYITSKYNDESN